jgi:hypothetical protein
MGYILPYKHSIHKEKLKDLIKQHPTYNDLEQRELLNKIK